MLWETMGPCAVAQREIEKAVREAWSTGRLQSDENLSTKMTLKFEALTSHGVMDLV
jgi:hypothetical protein